MAEPLDDVSDDTTSQPAADGNIGETPEGDAKRDQQNGYFDSSMGYASEGSTSGNLNPFPYRGPGSRQESRKPDSKKDAE